MDHVGCGLFRATDFIFVESEEVDHNSDTPFPKWEDEKDKVRQSRDVSPAQTLRTPCPFFNISTPGGSGILTNRLDEAKKQQLEAAYRAALMRSYPRSV
ncbi:hypothetical protein Plhal304r1_c002g0005451 [Plasmopara halstedii]